MDLKRLRKLVSENKIKEVLSILENESNIIDSKLGNQVILSRNRLIKLNSDITNNIISVNNAQIERNNIVLSLLDIFEKIEENELVEIKSSIAKARKINTRQKYYFFLLVFFTLISTITYFLKTEIYLFTATLVSGKAPALIYEKELEGIISEYIRDLEAEYNKINNDKKSSWGVSQTIKALSISKNDLQVGRYLEFVYSDFDTVTKSWKYYNNDDVSYHLGAHSWNVYTLSEIGNNLDSLMIDFLLEKQNIDGYWSIYPTLESNKASLYVTCHSLLALNSLLKNNNLKSEKKQKIQNAINTGILWIKTMKEKFENGIGWKDYPLDREYGTYSRSISSLVIFTLNILEKDNVTNLNKEYIKTIPYVFVESSYIENTNVVIQVSDSKTTFDYTRNMVVPSEILAICSIYDSGSTRQKYNCNIWLNSILEKLKDGNIPIQYWMKAELLIAFQHLYKKSTGDFFKK